MWGVGTLGDQLPQAQATLIDWFDLIYNFISFD